MDKELGKDISAGKSREAFLMDNCDKVEEKGYMKPFTPERLQNMKECLSEVDIQFFSIEEEKKEVVKEFKDRLSPLADERKRILTGLKNKAEHITENCYKFVDVETRETGFYNGAGDLIECRPAYAEELQATVFQVGRKTGTNN